MDYARSYFGKSLDNLTYQDVEGFFKEPKEESTRIEFKSYSAKHGNFKKNLEGVIRGLCALLNSEGGILIWGASEGQKVAGKQEDVFQGALSPVDELKEKDGLINTISDTITPLPTGIAVKILENGNNQYVYVFEVQVSNYRPHQYKHIYYARLDGQTRPAPHYLVEALMKRITYPNLESYLKITDLKRLKEGNYLDIEIIVCNFSEIQNEEDISLEISVGPASFSRFRERVVEPIPGKTYSGNRINIVSNPSVLYFGRPVVHYETIRFRDDQLIGSKGLSINEGEIIVTILFGGKRSPMKRSEYTIDALKKIDDPPDYNSLIIKKEENITMAEGQRRLGKGREDFLKTYLGR